MNEQPELSTSPEENATEDTVPESSGSSRFYVPGWVAIAFGIVALLLAGIIISNISGPLSDLILGSNVDVPIPDGAELLEENRDSDFASEELLYGIDVMNACEVLEFYFVEHDASCRPSPFVCTGDFEPDLVPDDRVYSVGECTHTDDNRVTGSSYRVEISSGYGESPATRFRIYVYD